MTTRRRRKPIHVTLATPVPGHPCPRCHEPLQYATGMSPTGPITPTPGDMTICTACETYLVFTDTLALRFATTAEIAAIDPEMRRVGSEAARQIGPRRKKPQ